MRVAPLFLGLLIAVFGYAIGDMFPDFAWTAGWFSCMVYFWVVGLPADRNDK